MVYQCYTLPIPKRDEAQLRDVFKGFSANSDGCLSRKELRKAFDSLGSCGPLAGAFLALRCCDLDGNGLIDGESEFDALVKYAKSIGYTVK